MKNKPYIIVTGATGVGKSDTVNFLAEHYPIEVINVDIGSFYTPVAVGTAKPNLDKTSCPHHFFNVLDAPISWNTHDFRIQAEELCFQIWQRGNVPVFVGGSVFYIKNLLYDYQQIPAVDVAVAKKLDTWSTQALYEYINTVDSNRARAIGASDRYRLLKACGLHKTTGKKPSDFQPFYNPLGDQYRILWLDRPRHELYERINQRTQSMLNSGWIEEVEALVGTSWEQLFENRKLLGYDLVLAYIRGGKKDKVTLEKDIAQTTRKYAKRQITFLRMLAKKLQKELSDGAFKEKFCHINLTFSDHSLYIRQSLETLLT